MKKNKLVQILKTIGLSEKESQVYLSALSLGKTSILNISRSAEIKRTTVYSIIESLKQKGLVKVEIVGLKKYFVAENPEKLELILENKKNEFKKNLPSFLALYNLKETESTIKYYEGMEFFKKIYMESLDEIDFQDEYLVITDQEKWFNLDPNFSVEYIEKRSKLPIKTRLLFQDSKIAQEHKKFERNYNEFIKILPKETSLQVDTLILPQKLIITQTVDPVSIIVIENKSVVEMQRNLFNIIWNSL